MVSAEFKRKKIDSLTLGERMNKIRSDRRLSLYEISKSTRIQLKYLEYLEAGEYEKLPADVYVRGFLKSYADYVGVNEKGLVRLYERERNIRRNIRKIDEEERIVGPVNLAKWVITPKIIAGAAVFLLIFFGFFYLYREIDKFISTPKLVITSPENGQTVESEVTNVKGTTEKDSEVFINDQPVSINDGGEFQQEVRLQKGLNNITVRSINKFEKETTRSISIQANYNEPQISVPDMDSSAGAGSDKKVSLEISVITEPTWLSLEADGSIVFSGVVSPGELKNFEAKERISVTSANGKNTLIKINGKDKGPLGNSQGLVKDMVFDVNSLN